MSSVCNVINVNQIKVSDLVRYANIKSNDFILTIESSSLNNLYSRRSTFKDIITFISNSTGSYTGSFSGSIPHAIGKITGSFTGSFKGLFTGKTSAKHTGSYSGSIFIKNQPSSTNYFDLVFANGPGQQGLNVDPGMLFYDPSNNTLTVDTNVYAGNAFDVIVNTSPSLFATPNNITLGAAANTLTIGNTGVSTFTKFLSRQVRGHFTGSFTGSFSGSTLGNLISKNAKLSGSFSGSYYGLLRSKNSILTGSLTGSLTGFVSGSKKYNNSQKVAFYGTSSWSKTSNNALTAALSTGNPIGGGTAEYSTIWLDPTTIGDNDYIRRSNSMTATGGGWPSSATTGRTILTRPLNIGTQDTYGSGYVGQHLIQFSSSTATQPRVDMYDLGLQISNNYIRTAASFCIFYSGSYDAGQWTTIGKDAYLRPTTEAKSGKYGFTSLVARQRLLGVGHFYRADNVSAQLHVHLSSSYGWPSHTYDNTGFVSGYQPNKNVFLITSGSTFTKLLRVSGSGQLDVKGDIVAFSTFATSDERLKTNISSIENGLEKINKINPVEFNWKHNNKKDYGVLAQEIEKIYPEFVTQNMDGFKVVNYNPLIAMLIKSVQELKSELDLLKQSLK